jgi:hypothetical protein
VRGANFQPLGVGGLKLQAKALRLPAHAVAQFESSNAFRETGVVLHQIGGHDLTAVDKFFQKQGFEPGAAGIDAGGETRGAPADDD